MKMLIAKYRDGFNVDRWYLTNFTMEQVEGRLIYLEKQLKIITKEKNALYGQTLIEENIILKQQIAELHKLLIKYGTHKDRCAAFPAVSNEQIIAKCDCGLQYAITIHKPNRPVL